MKRVLVLLMLLMCWISFAGLTSFADEKFEVILYVGEVIDLDSYLIENQVLSAEENMSWSTGNDRVVDVNSSGRVEALKEGKATIYAKDKKNSSRVATIKVKVLSMVDSFALKDEEISIRVGEVYNLEYDIEAVAGQEKVLKEDIEWNSSNSKIVEVDDEGQIVGIKEGTAKVHAKTVDGRKKDYVLVTVSGIQEDILVENGVNQVEIFVGGQHAFKATSNGKDVTLGVEWSSVLDDIVEIDDAGIAKGKEPGRTQIKATTKDKKKFDTVTVKVVSMVKDVELNHNKITLEKIGDTVDLDYKLIFAIPNMAPFEDEVEWKSSNSNIARVDSEGVVTAKGKGIALITATSVDGEFEAHCSITVEESDDERKIPVGKIYLKNPEPQLYVGQKYALPIVIEPLDATEKDLKFYAKLGSGSQVDEEDDVYYFTPVESGKNEIKIVTESEEEFTYKVEVISPIKGVEIDTSHLYKDKDVYYFYVGQKMILKPNFELRKNYTVDDIFESDVTWTVDDKDVATINREKREKLNKNDETEYDYYLVGKEKGVTKLNVKSKDGKHTKKIKIKVLSSYKSLNLVDQVTLPINVELEPEVHVAMRDDLKYALVSGENYELEKEFKIEHQYVEKAIIEQEIAIAQEIIVDLQKSAIHSNNSALIYGEINEHKSRIAKLELVLDTAKNGFCEIKEKLELKDVFGNDYVVAELNDGVITGKRNGKIQLKVTFPGTNIVDKGIYNFSSDLKGILIVNESGEVVSLNESGFSRVLTDETLKKQLELAARIEARFGKRTMEDKPSPEYIEAILNLEALGFIPSELNDDYRKPVTRIELAETFIALIEYISGESLKRPTSGRFKDTSSREAVLAYDLGLVDVLLPTMFDPYEKVTPITMAKAIDRMRAVLSAYGYKQDRLVLENDIGKGQKLFTDMNQINPVHRAYIEKYAISYGIIEGVDNKLNPDKPLTREVFLYYISKLVF